MAVSLQLLKSQARRGYEWSRLRRALLGAVPIAALVTASAIAAPKPFASALVGAFLVFAGIAALWAGRGLQKALLPSILAWSLPLAAALGATRLGHAWLGSACTKQCVFRRAHLEAPAPRSSLATGPLGRPLARACSPPALGLGC